jgi:hypothetical protein
MVNNKQLKAASNSQQLHVVSSPADAVLAVM